MIITVAAQKGGVSKTTTAAAIAQALEYQGKKVLLIDTDGQRSASLIYGITNDEEGGSYDLITGKAAAEDLIQRTPAGAIIPASPYLDRLDVELSKTAGKNYLLKEAIEPIKKKYDFIIIDTAPGLNATLIQALTAADRVIIPILSEPQALSGLHTVAETISEVKKYCNPSLKIAAVVLTQYNPRATLTKQYGQLIRKQCKDKGLPCAETTVRKGIAVQEAQALRRSLYKYAPNSNPAADYIELLKEIKLIK